MSSQERQPRRSRPEPLPPGEQARVLNATANLLFQRNENGDCIDLNCRADIMRGLEERGISVFNNSDGKPTFIGKDTIGELVRLSCGTIEVRGTREHSVPLDEAARILKKQFNLKQLEVLGQLDSGGGTSNCLGKIGAALFHKMLSGHDGAPPVIAIGGGQTIHDMMWWLNPPSKSATIIPTNYATRLSDREMVYDSSYLATHVHWLCNKSAAKIVSFPPLPTYNHAAAAEWHSMIYKANQDLAKVFESELDPDITFLGVGKFDSRAVSISRVYKHLGIDYLSLSDMPTPPVGDINYCFFDQNGNDIGPTILSNRLRQLDSGLLEKLREGSFFDNEYCHPFLVGFNIKALKRLVRMGKDVIVIAGGDGAKSPAVFPLLKHEIINGLVTDADTIYDLLRLLRQSNAIPKSS